MTIARRTLLAAGLALPAISAKAQGTTIKMGSLKLIHSIAPHFYEKFAHAGVRMEIIPFESPAECKNAVVTKSVDFGAFGIAAGILGAAAREPLTIIASCCDKGMAVVARKDGPVEKLTDLRGKRVAIWPGSTQEVFILERMKMEGMSIRDITSVRVSFSEMHLALARGDVDAYVGAEPAPGVSVASGIGKIVEYPYSTPMGALNMVFGAHHETVAARPDLCRTILNIHRQASEFAMANREAMIDMAIAKLGQQRAALEISAPNVDLNWKMTPTMLRQAHTYADHMLALRQIRQLPDFATFFDTKFSDEMAKNA